MNRSYRYNGKTSRVFLDDAFWRAVHAIAYDTRRDLGEIIGEAVEGCQGNKSAAVRAFVLRWMAERDPATSDGVRVFLGRPRKIDEWVAAGIGKCSVPLPKALRKHL